MLKKIKHITLVVSLILSGALASTLKDIKYDPKGNGLMLSIEYSDPIPDDNIIGWKSDRNWLYITLLGVKHSNEIVPKSDPNNLIDKVKDSASNFHIYTFGGLKETNKWLEKNNYA